MKNVLIITYFFPPDVEVGAVRPYGFTKYLPLFGWNPIILTSSYNNPSDSDLQIFYTPKSDIVNFFLKFLGFNSYVNFENSITRHKSMNINFVIINFFKIIVSVICYPDPQKYWLNNATAMGDNICNKYKIDVIMSTSPPETCHLVANRLVKKHNLFWIVDFRDLWTQNHYYPYSQFRKVFERKLEIKTLNGADVITTVSQPLADKLSTLHKNKPVYSIPNGFDPDMMNPGTVIDPKFRIVYTGKLYDGKRDPVLLFLAVSSLCHECKIERQNVQIDFYGHREKWLQTEVERYHLQDTVTFHGHVPREIAIDEQRKAQILLHLTWNNLAEKGVYTGKLFDYLAARRPILSMGLTDGGVVKELLDQTQAGVHVSNEEELKKYLMKAYREYKETGLVQYQGIDAEVMKYSHKEMARKLVEVLEGVTGNSKK
ncbi:MAG: glycosyltransferase [Methanoregula sp.]